MCALYDYDTDVTDGQWELIEPLLPERTWQLGGSGRPPLERIQALHGILSLNKTG